MWETVTKDPGNLWRTPPKNNDGRNQFQPMKQIFLGNAETKFKNLCWLIQDCGAWSQQPAQVNSVLPLSWSPSLVQWRRIVCRYVVSEGQLYLGAVVTPANLWTPQGQRTVVKEGCLGHSADTSVYLALVHLLFSMPNQKMWTRYIIRPISSKSRPRDCKTKVRV